VAFVQVNNANFYYEQHGKGAPLVCIAGYTCDSTYWKAVVEDLAKHFTVFLIDNRGSGQTKELVESKYFSVEQMADDAVELMSALGVEKAHYLGTSMGGTIVQTIAAKRPESVDQLIIGVSSAKWRQSVLNALNNALTMREQGADFDSIFDTSLPWLVGERFYSNPDNVALYKELLLNAEHPQSVEDQRKQFNVLTAWDGREQLKKIQAKTLVIHAEEDLISLRYESDYIAQRIKNSHLCSLMAAHGLTLDVGGELSQVACEFLAQR